MNKSTNTKRALTMSVVSLLVCVAVFIGSTFAWFTDSASVNVSSIRSGKLDIGLEMSEDGVTWTDAETKGQVLEFVKDDGAAANEAILWEPGCTYKLPQLRVVNKGNLALKYRIVITGINGSAKLNEAIEWTINGLDINSDLHLAAGVKSDVLTISGHMKETAGNEYQGLTIDGVSITVVATQDTVEFDSQTNQYDGLAAWDGTAAADVAEDNGVYTITNGQQLAWFANQVNSGNKFSGKTVKLASDINLFNQPWTPAGNVDSYPSITFAGVFDGGNHTIYNLNTSATGAYAAAGLFGSITGKVKNLRVVNATVDSTHYAGVIAGYSSANVGMEISNCYVENATVTSYVVKQPGGSYDNGDKAGGIIGYCVAGDVVKGCTVKNSSVTGYRDIGGIAGASAASITYCTVDGVTVSQNNENGYQSSVPTTIDKIVGRKLDGIVLNDNTAVNSEIVLTANPDNVQTMLDNASDGTVIKLAPGNYGTLRLGQSKAKTEVVSTGNEYARYVRTVEGLTIEGQDGAVIDGFEIKVGHIYGAGVNPVTGLEINGTTNGYYSTVNVKDLKLSNIGLTKSVYIAADTSEYLNLDGMTITGCSFIGDAANITVNAAWNKLAHIAGGSNYIRNVLIENCNVTNAFQGVYTYGNRDITIRNCTFDNLDHNAVAIQDNQSYNGGTIVVEGNTISNVTDRVFRVGNFKEGSLVFKNNTIVNSGDTSDPSNPYYKAASIASGVSVSFDGNTVDGNPWAPNA